MLCIHPPGLLRVVSLSAINRTQLWKTDYLDNGSTITGKPASPGHARSPSLDFHSSIYILIIHPPRLYRFPLIFRTYSIFSIYQWCHSALTANKSAQSEIGSFEMHRSFGLVSVYILLPFCISALLPQGLRFFLFFSSDFRLYSHWSDTNSIVPILSGLVLSAHWFYESHSSIKHSRGHIGLAYERWDFSAIFGRIIRFLDNVWLGYKNRKKQRKVGEGDHWHSYRCTSLHSECYFLFLIFWIQFIVLQGGALR